MISIIIPVWNQAGKIRKCLDSILEQSFLGFEVVVVDDESTDDLNIVLDEYEVKFQEKNIDFLVIHQENQGPQAARNRGFFNSKGKYVIFLDADIMMKPDMLEKMLNVLKENLDRSYVYSAHKFGFKTFKLWKFNAEKLREMPYIHTSSLIRREHFPGFDENIKRLQDWDLWLTMLEKGHTGIWIPEVLFQVSAGGTMSAWIPSFAYKLLPFLPKVKKYKKAVEIIKNKHKLEP
ncbi:glycosyltransferase family 2 protein [Candidatus Falkowbacteria bacterium]|jgi:glycosyltransferase involved in cell wall biosynthesis|nr:glycosyltransferase family 2 protein [Candidatus Falkowbacteria bacterium]MBT4433273.1 glycosyltransferase family 2 protein [Candidatus Falkowbacteria bacterium]